MSTTVLDDDLKAAIDSVAMEINLWSLSKFESGNSAALSELVSKHNVDLVKFPDGVLENLQKLTSEVLAEEAASDVMFKTVGENYANFQLNWNSWAAICNQANNGWQIRNRLRVPSIFIIVVIQCGVWKTIFAKADPIMMIPLMAS